ncbi:MAG: MFS transporter, partial [Planctomycetota bacterium]
AETIRRTRQKKVFLAWLSVAMGVCYLILSAGWRIRPAASADWFIAAFLFLYTIFFACSGLFHVAFGTLQGKLIRPDLRGRLMSVANVVGVFVAVTAVMVLLPNWLSGTGAAFDAVFGFSGSCFVAVAVLSLLAREPVDVPIAQADQALGGVAEVLVALKSDATLRGTALMSAMGSCSIMLFPHYQALARERLELDFTVLLSWVVIQNIGTAVFSLITGPLADRYGNRLALRFVSVGLFLVPLVALWVSHQSARSSAWFNSVFFMIGMTPIYIRLVQHYTLELTSTANHPAYLAAISLCNALPFVFSPFIGWLVSSIGFDAVFIGVDLIVLGALLATWFVPEPRNVLAKSN